MANKYEEGAVMMTKSDLLYLELATPQELLALTNGIPWQLCVGIKAALVQGYSTIGHASKKAWLDEMPTWLAAGAPAEDDAAGPWLDERRDMLRPCDECGGVKYLPPAPGRRVTFTRVGGFGFHSLCGDCCNAFDYSYEPATLAELATRWKGRCMDAQAVQR